MRRRKERMVGEIMGPGGVGSWGVVAGVKNRWGSHSQQKRPRGQRHQHVRVRRVMFYFI